MLCGSEGGVKLFLAALRSKKVNRNNLTRLTEWFQKAGSQEEVLADFQLNSEKIEVLRNLAAHVDGWYPISDIIPEKDAKNVKNLLQALLEAGLIGVKPWKKLMNLSDSGRYILIMCAEKIENTSNTEKERDV
ncbi:MAG: hypothetical protein LBE27_06985 [Deltaproteobacteria bacterium]|jgi:hypothetical protein|nr:hypothetical protein [Deltaproteobacteria bacterium]